MASLDFAMILPKSLRERLAPLIGGERRTLVLAGIAGALAVAVLAVWWWSNPAYSVLYAGLSAEEGGRAIAELQKLNIPYTTADGGRVILVPAGDIGPARLQLALRGVPRQEENQWTQLDNQNLGVSPFVEQVHYVRAIEAALAHTIREIDGVASATVELAVPKQSEFLGDAPKPSASVMLRLRPGLVLSPAQVDGIAGLVAASVPGLTRQHVTVVDQSGKVLDRNSQDELQQVPQQLEVAREIERRYDTAIVNLLTPVLGAENFRVSVNADIDFARAKESSIKYGSGHVLSQDESVRPHSSSADVAIGIPGALSNRPPENPTTAVPPPAPATPAAPADAAKPAEKAEPPSPDTHRTTNYDLDHTVQYLERPAWTLRALSVAVLVKSAPGKALTPDRLEAIKTLVGSAVGVGQDRQVAVVDLPFEAAKAAEDGAGWAANGWIAAAEQNGLLALAGLLLLVGAVTPLRRQVSAHLAAAGALPGALLAGGGRSATETATVPGVVPHALTGLHGRPSLRLQGSFEADVEIVRALVTSEPDRAAQVIREWIARDRSRVRQTG